MQDEYARALISRRATLARRLAVGRGLTVRRRDGLLGLAATVAYDQTAATKTAMPNTPAVMRLGLTRPTRGGKAG